MLGGIAKVMGTQHAAAYESAVGHQYRVPQLVERIYAALESVGVELDDLSVAALNPVSHFHVGGLGATLQLAARAEISANMRVLDVGCGVGGPARTLAERFGCQVVGLDLTEEFIHTAEILTTKVKLNHLVRFMLGNAMDMPFQEMSFDGGWMQHAQMNIDDKRGLSVELHRVLKPGAPLFMHGVCLGRDESSAQFPLPWASNPELSYLSEQAELQKTFEEAGFETAIWEDVTQPSLKFFETLVASMPEEGPQPQLGTHILMENGPLKIRNMYKSLACQSLTIFQAVLRRV